MDRWAGTENLTVTYFEVDVSLSTSLRFFATFLLAYTFTIKINTVYCGEWVEDGD